MYEKDFTEKDWKLFRKKIAGWQEAYMAGLMSGRQLRNETIKLYSCNCCTYK